MLPKEAVASTTSLHTHCPQLQIMINLVFAGKLYNITCVLSLLMENGCEKIEGWEVPKL